MENMLFMLILFFLLILTARHTLLRYLKIRKIDNNIFYGEVSIGTLLLLLFVFYVLVNPTMSTIKTDVNISAIDLENIESITSAYSNLMWINSILLQVDVTLFGFTIVAIIFIFKDQKIKMLFSHVILLSLFGATISKSFFDSLLAISKIFLNSTSPDVLINTITYTHNSIENCLQGFTISLCYLFIMGALIFSNFPESEIHRRMEDS